MAMKEEIRRAIAHAVVAQSDGKPSSHVYSYDRGRHTAFTGSGPGGYDHDAGAHVSGSGSNLYHHGLGKSHPAKRKWK